MPYPNEHAMRLNPPDKYKRIRRQNDKFGSGIDAIFGVTKDGKTELQAIRFDKSKFTPEQAKKWLEDHDYKITGFEPAQKTEESVSMNRDAGKEGKMDNLDYGYGLVEVDNPFAKKDDEKVDYGKAIDKAVTALEEGDTDSALKVLKQCQDRMKAK